MATDILTIVFSYFVAALIRFSDPLHDQAISMLAVLLPVYICIALNHRAYHITSVVEARVGGGRAAAAFLITLSTVGLVVFFLKTSEDFSRAVFGTGAVLALALLPLTRFMVARASHKLFGASPINEVIIEDGVSVSAGKETVVLNAERDNLMPRLDQPAMLDRLGRYLQSADRVIVACPPERRVLWAAALKGADVAGEVFASELDDLGAVGLDRYHGRNTLVIAIGPLGAVDRMMKRILDLSLVTLSLPVTLPLMALIAIAVKLDSAGPVLFVQERVGLGNRLFPMYKFRSMYVARQDNDGSTSTSRDDDRITRIGRLLRQSSLDELPQLLNVLSGSMSIVGPRPHALGSRAENLLFWDIDAAYWHRHAVKPGLTGLAQIRGFRGATNAADDLRFRLQADLEYLSGWSIWRDIVIIFRTFRVLVHRNAY